MLIIFLSILFTTCILAGPVPAPSNSWNKLKNDKSLERFHSTLLNETLLPFLNECYTDPVGQPIGEPKTRDAICSRYFDAILQLNSSEYVVNVPNVTKIRDFNAENEKTPFCDQKHNFPIPKFYLHAPPRDFNKSAVCGHSCLDDDAVTVKPICKFLVWMGDEIQKQHEIEKNNKKVADGTPKIATIVTPVALVPAIIPSAAPAVVPTSSPKLTKVPETATVKSNVATVKENHKNLEPVKKDETIVEKPAAEIPKPLPTKTIPTQVVEEVTKNNDVQGKNTQQELPVPQDKVEQPVMPVFPKPQNDKKTENENENPQIQLPQDTKDDNEPGQNGDQLIQPPKPIELEKTDSMDQPESEEELNSMDVAENDDYNNLGNPKTNNVGIAHPDEIEQNQSSSPEIIGGNDIIGNNKPLLVDPFLEESGSNFFTYFLVGMFLCMAMYVIYHNKSKVLALLLEGRRSDKGRGGRRKHTAAYRKLDSNLEEAITSSASGRTTQIIY